MFPKKSKKLSKSEPISGQRSYEWAFISSDDKRPCLRTSIWGSLFDETSDHEEQTVGAQTARVAVCEGPEEGGTGQLVSDKGCEPQANRSFLFTRRHSQPHLSLKRLLRTSTRGRIAGACSRQSRTYRIDSTPLCWCDSNEMSSWQAGHPWGESMPAPAAHAEAAAAMRAHTDWASG
jgi:hypothetical protein